MKTVAAGLFVGCATALVVTRGVVTWHMLAPLWYDLEGEALVVHLALCKAAVFSALFTGFVEIVGRRMFARAIKGVELEWRCALGCGFALFKLYVAVSLARRISLHIVQVIASVWQTSLAPIPHLRGWKPLQVIDFALVVAAILSLIWLFELLGDKLLGLTSGMNVHGHPRQTFGSNDLG